MNRFNNKSKHDQRTALPPRCSHTAVDESVCRQPSAMIIDGDPLCLEHGTKAAMRDWWNEDKS